MNRRLYGVGINDADYIVNPVMNGERVRCPFYRVWQNMLKRCYSESSLHARPTYIGCTVAKEWHSFMSFRSWMVRQDWQGKHLDKDIMIEGNKIYSSKTCLFVGAEINSIFIDSQTTRGEYPAGVSFHKKAGLYQANVGVSGKKVYLGCYSTPEKAELAYKNRKSKVIYDAAINSKDQAVMSALLQRSYSFLDRKIIG